MPADPQVAAQPAWTLRPFRPSDAAAISAIARDSGQAAQWPTESYANVAGSPDGLFLVCESGSQILAFLVARQAADEAEILNIAVHSAHRRKGIASALLSAALQHFQHSSVSGIFLELRESNLPALALYRQFGFVVSGRRKSYYAHPAEDALCMIRRFESPSL